MKVKIITDSVADLPKDLAFELGIDVVPLTVNFDTKSYLDGVELESDKFFKMLGEAERLPTTSQVSPGVFMDVFENNLKEYDHIICITISSELSGTYNSALQAVNILETDRVTVIDSRNVTFAEGIIAIRAAIRALDGYSPEDIIGGVNCDIESIETRFVVDTLEYLLKGGRLSKTEAALGTLLNIKPILALRDGALKSHGKIKGKKKVIKALLSELEAISGGNRIETLGLFHSMNPEELQVLRREIEENFDIGKIYESKVGSVVGVYSGPGALALTVIR